MSLAGANTPFSGNMFATVQDVIQNLYSEMRRSNFVEIRKSEGNGQFYLVGILGDTIQLGTEDNGSAFQYRPTDL